MAGLTLPFISNLLDSARPKLPARHKVDIKKVVQEALSHATVPENVEMVSQLEEPPPILADPDQLVQAILNIIVNVIHAVPEGDRAIARSEALGQDWGAELGS